MIDLFCGLGGWADGGVAAGYDVVGFDIERHEYGDMRYPAQLVIQDVLTIDGAQFRDASLIVASPPCTEFSYMAMPWTRAKQIARALRGEDEFPDGYKGSRTIAELTALFDACFRIQREASAAAGRHIPMVVENVKGARPWVGWARWNYGSYYLWGDVPALMPMTVGVRKNPGFRFDGSGRSFQSESVERAGVKVPGLNWSSPDPAKRGCFRDSAGIKQHGSGREWFAGEGKISRMTSSGSPARKAASAMIAKIPFPLAHHVAQVYLTTPAQSPAPADDADIASERWSGRL
ncbi:MAG TPA: hypothetical protein DCZ11_08930 [Gammaproteobacteria bacterium]|nr:hypothetical protein [Gammaproteobacteria bacterium]MCH78553.1 hypothetical protein [Gammaproteobacteria bacterium]